MIVSHLQSADSSFEVPIVRSHVWTSGIQLSIGIAIGKEMSLAITKRKIRSTVLFNGKQTANLYYIVSKNSGDKNILPTVGDQPKTPYNLQPLSTACVSDLYPLSKSYICLSYNKADVVCTKAWLGAK